MTTEAGPRRAEAESPPLGQPLGRTHMVRLAAIGAAAALVRIVATLAVTRDSSVGTGDGFFYSATGTLIGQGRGYIEPLLAEIGQDVPTANLPPGWPGLLGVFSWLGIDTPLGHRLVGSVLGGVTVIVVGVLATKLSTRRAGLLAAAGVALHPGLVTADGSLHAETLYGILAILAVIVSVRSASRGERHRTDAVALGVIVGLAALVRGDILILAPFLAWAASASRPVGNRLDEPGGHRSRAGFMMLAGVVALATIAPWTIRNAVQLDGFVLVSTNEATLIGGANCDATYGGPRIGSWEFSCLPPVPGRSEAERSAVLRETGLTYAREHADRIPAVLVARQGRTWGLWQPFGDAGPGRDDTLAALGTGWWLLALVPGSFFGLRVLRRRGVAILAPSTPFLAAAVISVIGYGTPRFRYVPELAATALTAVAVDAWLTRRSRRTSAAV